MYKIEWPSYLANKPVIKHASRVVALEHLIGWCTANNFMFIDHDFDNIADGLDVAIASKVSNHLYIIAVNKVAAT